MFLFLIGGISMKKKVAIWSEMDNLIKDSGTPERERELFLRARKELDQGKNEQAVAAQLKSGLSFLSFKEKLSPKTVSFFTEISRLYLGYGRRDMINF
ncbi:hypothetical protein IV84_GL001866 [Pediococcus damnosus]|nr:hypothetical protein IV84_GL001866 [Pediococcus damnosus]